MALWLKTNLQEGTEEVGQTQSHSGLVFELRLGSKTDVTLQDEIIRLE